MSAMLRALAAFLALAVLLAGTAARAQESALELTLDASEVGLEDLLVATVTASGEAAGAGEPHLELGPGFRIAGTSRSQSISFINGRTSMELRWQFTLQPLQQGSFDIGPALLEAGGRKLRSGKVRVRVVAGSVAPPPPAPVDPWAQLFGGGRFGRRSRTAARGKVLLVAELDKRRAWVGEQVTYSLRVLTQLDVRTVKPRTDPQLTGFWSETIEVPNPPTPERTMHEGEAYTSYLLRRLALFPTAPGRVEIPAAVWDLSVVVPDGLFGEVQDIARSSEPLVLEVLALPEEGRPDGFSGAVGEFEIEARADKTEVKVGEAVALKVTLRGTGNLKTLAPPEPPVVADAKSYASTASQAVSMKGGRMSGARTFEYVIVPNAAGTRDIPAIRLPYWSPGRREWRVAETEAIPLRVDKGEGPAVAASRPAGPAPAGSRRAVAPVRRDVAYLKLTAEGLGNPRRPLWRSGLVQASLAFPLVANLTALLWRWGREREARDPAAVRRRGARRAAERRLSEAGRGRQARRPGEVASAVAEAVTGFIADAADEAAAGLTRDRIGEIVTARAGAERARAVAQLLDRCDYLRFTPAGGAAKDLDRLVEDARRLVAGLERAMLRGRAA